MILAFVRLVTHPAVFERPLGTEDALRVVRHWLDQPAATTVDPGDRHPDLLRDLLSTTGSAGNLVNDAHLAALSLEHRCDIVSYDADFARFAGVRWRTPWSA